MSRSRRLRRNLLASLTRGKYKSLWCTDSHQWSILAAKVQLESLTKARKPLHLGQVTTKMITLRFRKSLRGRNNNQIIVKCILLRLKIHRCTPVPLLLPHSQAMSWWGPLARVSTQKWAPTPFTNYQSRRNQYQIQLPQMKDDELSLWWNYSLI